MVNHRGFNVGVMYGVESTYGTAATRNTSLGVVTSIAPTITNNNIVIRGIGQGRDVVNIMPGPLDVALSINTQVWDFDILKAFIGPLTGAGSSGNKYTITEANNVGTTTSTDIVPLSIEVLSNESTDDVDVYEGCIGQSFSLNMTQGAPLIGTFNFICEDVTSSTSATAYTPTSTAPYIFTGATFKWGASPSTVAKVESAVINYSNNLYVYRSLGSRFINQPEATDRDYTFSVTAIMTDAIATSLRDDAYGQANSPADGAGGEFTSRSLHLTFSDGASGKQADIKLANCIIEDISKPVGSTRELVKVTFTGRAKTANSNVFVEWWTV